jgi:hypothetical protein
MVRTGHRGRAAAEQTPRLRARERQKRSSPNERQQQSSMLDSLQSEVRPETEDYSKDARATRLHGAAARAGQSIGRSRSLSPHGRRYQVPTGGRR